MLRAFMLMSLCVVPGALRGGEPFDVSLASSSADLGPYYRAAIRQATELYLGDGSLETVVARTQWSSAAGFETEEFVDYSRGTTHSYLRRTSAAGTREIIAEAHFDTDPFPPELCSIYRTSPVAGFSVLWGLAILLEGRPVNVALAQAKSDPIVVNMRCETWQKHHRFDDLRSCYLSVVHIGARKADVVAMLGPGQRVTISHSVWNPPREAYAYTPADRTNFHCVAVYKDGIVVEQCSYSLESTGEASVALP
jgi:hypothetical protein